MDKFFNYKKRGSSLLQEIICGIIVFFSMSYILPVNASILSSAGADSNAVFFATAIVSGICCLLMGLLANYPVALSAGMGINSFLAFSVCGSMGYSFNECLLVVFVSGIIFFVLTLTSLRKKIIQSIPKTLRYALSAGLGAFICFVGLKNGGIIRPDPEGTFIKLGDLSNPVVLLSLFGIVLSLILMQCKGKIQKFSIVISIFATAIVGVILGLLGVENMPKFTYTPIKEGYSAFFNNIGLCFSKDAFNVFKKIETYAVIFSLVFVQLFDTTATLVAIGDKIGLTNEKGELVNVDKAMLADSIGAVICAPLGTSSVTCFAESTIGVESGAKSGLSTCVTGLLFFLATLIYPLFSVFLGIEIGNFNYTPVTSLALVSVGSMMFSNLKDIDWDDKITVTSSFLIIILMVLTFSISDGLGLGLIFYCLMMLFAKRGKEVPIAIYIISIFFIINYLFKVIL